VSAAFILSQFGSKGCEYIQFGDPNEVSDFFLRNQVDYAGLYCFHTQSGVNYMYSDVFEYSNEHSLARSMGLATTIMGAIAWCFYVVAICVRVPPFLWLLVSLTLVATCICEGLTFKFFSTDMCNVTECGLGTSSKCSISACVFWFISALMTCATFKDAQDRKAEQVGGGQDGEP